MAKQRYHVRVIDKDVLGTKSARSLEEKQFDMAVYYNNGNLTHVSYHELLMPEFHAENRRTLLTGLTQWLSLHMATPDKLDRSLSFRDQTRALKGLITVTDGDTLYVTYAKDTAENLSFSLVGHTTKEG